MSTPPVPSFHVYHRVPETQIQNTRLLYTKKTGNPNTTSPGSPRPGAATAAETAANLTVILQFAVALPPEEMDHLAEDRPPRRGAADETERRKGLRAAGNEGDLNDISTRPGGRSRKEGQGPVTRATRSQGGMGAGSGAGRESWGAGVGGSAALVHRAVASGRVSRATLIDSRDSLPEGAAADGDGGEAQVIEPVVSVKTTIFSLSCLFSPPQ